MVGPIDVSANPPMSPLAGLVSVSDDGWLAVPGMTGVRQSSPSCLAASCKEQAGLAPFSDKRTDLLSH
jgi:hypothetical protein